MIDIISVERSTPEVTVDDVVAAFERKGVLHFSDTRAIVLSNGSTAFAREAMHEGYLLVVYPATTSTIIVHLSRQSEGGLPGQSGLSDSVRPPERR